MFAAGEVEDAAAAMVFLVLLKGAESPFIIDLVMKKTPREISTDTSYIVLLDSMKEAVYIYNSIETGIVRSEW